MDEKLQVNKASERHKASPEALYRHFLKSVPHDSLQEIFAILREEKEDPYYGKGNFPRDSGQYEKPPF